MFIARWEPSHDMTTLQQRVNRIFGDSLARWSSDESGFGTWMPPVEIFEKEDTLILRAEVPGMSQKDIDLHVENGILTLKGEKRRDEIAGETLHRAERYYGSFVRVFTLPTTVDVEKIRATYKDGILEVMLPKAEAARPKRIDIRN